MFFSFYLYYRNFYFEKSFFRKVAGELDSSGRANVGGIYRVNINLDSDSDSVKSSILSSEEVAIKPEVCVRVKRSFVGFWIRVSKEQFWQSASGVIWK